MSKKIDKVVQIRIPNFDKHNPNHGQKRPTWFKMDNNFFLNNTIYALDVYDRLTFLYLLCTRSVKNEDIFEINLTMVRHFINKKPCQLLVILEKLRKTALIELPNVLPSRLEKNRIEENRIEENRLRVGEAQLAAPEKNGGLISEKKTKIKILNPEIVKQSTIPWLAYKKAYFKKYGVDPVSNAKVNGQLSQLIKRLSIDEVESVICFYLEHSAFKYCNAMHPVGLLLSDAEKIRTEWATGKVMTSKIALDNERKSGFDSQLERIANGEI